MKLFITLFLLCFTLNLTAEEQMLKETHYKYVEESIGKGKPNFIEVGSESCHTCQVMGKLLYKVVQKYPNYNINFVNLKKERSVARTLKIQMIPTQIIYDKNGEEVYRHIGGLSSDALDRLFTMYKFNGEK